MKRTIFVLGGTGYVGKAIVKRLIEEDFLPLLLVRPGAEKKIPKQVLARIDTIEGDAKDLLALKEKIAKYKPFAMIYLIGLLREDRLSNMLYIDYHYHWLKLAVDLSREIGIKRFLLASANGAKERGTSYQTTKFMGEEYLKHSGLAWTIFRPSVIVGADPLPHFVSFIEKLTRFPIVLMVGDGRYKLAPVYRGDVAEIFVKSLSEEKMFRKLYHLCGPNAYPYRTLVRMVANVKQRNVVLLPLPLLLTMSLAKLLRTDELIRMLVAGNTCRENTVWKDLHIKPTSFEKVVLEYRTKKQQFHIV